MEKKTLILVLIGLSFIAIGVGLIASKEMTIRTGTTILLETASVDPRDLLRGDYVVLNYAISVVDTSGLPGDHSYRSGQAVYVGLENDGRFWKAVSMGLTKPGHGTFLRGKVKTFYASRADIEYGLESYFVAEGEGRSIEKMMRGEKSSLAVETVVDKQGSAVIKRLVPVEGRARERQPRPQPIVRTLKPVVENPSPCGNGVCETGENYTTCTQDCAEVIYPFDSDVESCTDSTGKLWPATGPGAATWFNWNRCSRQKSYQVNPGEEIILHAYTDNCASCVCNYPNFYISESRNNGWLQTKSFNFGNGQGSSTYQPYTPDSDRIKITAAQCFYLEVLRKK
jgi:uncharacterized membrane-anchored protein